MNNEILKYLDTDSPRWTSIFYGQKKRYIKAKQEVERKEDKERDTIEEIIDFVLEFFKKCEIKTIKFHENDRYKKFRPIQDNTNLSDFNKSIKKNYGVNDNKDIIWMKFTKNGCLGVVATSNDINFEIVPIDKVQFFLRNHQDAVEEDSPFIPNLQKENWEYSASATLISYVGKEWEKSNTLVFPLLNLNSSVERHRIETAVGNYLSKEKGVPIIDFYSHRINTRLKREEL